MKTSTRLNIFNSKKYLKKYTDTKYNPEGNSNFYLASYTKSIGYYILKKIFNVKSKNFFESFIYILLDIYYGINYSIKTVTRRQFKNSFSRIVLTWGFKKTLIIKVYFMINISTHIPLNKKKILWLIIYLDNELPKNSIKLNFTKNKKQNFLNLHSWLKFLFLLIYQKSLKV